MILKHIAFRFVSELNYFIRNSTTKAYQVFSWNCRLLGESGKLFTVKIGSQEEKIVNILRIPSNSECSEHALLDLSRVLIRCSLPISLVYRLHSNFSDLAVNMHTIQKEINRIRLVCWALDSNLATNRNHRISYAVRIYLEQIEHCQGQFCRIEWEIRRRRRRTRSPRRVI